MLGTWLSLVFSIVLLIALYTLSDRLQFITNKTAHGRLAFFAGTILLLFGSLWTALRFRPDYVDWFVPAAYTFIDIAHLIVIVSGLIFIVFGLGKFFNSLIDLHTDVEFREQKLSILENLQRDAREPYQFLELLSLAIKEIASSIPECAGAVFLVGRNRKQFLLATSVGLNSEETNRLEFYPIGDNDISQSVEAGEPILSGNFYFYGESGEEIESRFKSALILPLISGMDKIGCIVLVSAIERIFSQSDIKILAPVGEWLAEKIKSARAAKEITTIKKEKEELTAQVNDNSGRIDNTAKSFDTPDILNNLCNSITGFAESDSVHLAAVQSGNLEILAGSEPLVNIGEQYSDALVKTIGRGKTAVVNQNVDNEQGDTFTSTSTLVYPLEKSRSEVALILRRHSSQFALDNYQLKTLGVLGHLARLAHEKSDSERIELTRRLGFDKVIQLLRLPSRLTFEEDPGFFTRHLASLLPNNSSVYSFVEKDGALKLADSFGGAFNSEENVRINFGEGFIGRAADKRISVTLSGKREIERALEEFSDKNRETLNSLVWKLPYSPGFTIVSPITLADQVSGVVVFLFEALSEIERREWERLVTLACGLYSMRMSVAALNQKQPEPVTDHRLNQIVNAVNNNLAAVIGNAEILMTKSELDPEIRAQLQSIMNEAEIAAGQVRALIKEKDIRNISVKEKKQTDLNLNDISARSLQRSHVSENLYMIAGRARELDFKPGDLGAGQIEFSDIRIEELFDGAVNKFAALAAEDEIISISTYKRDDFAFLDISRRRRNLPPVESVAGFGNYQIPEEAIKMRPTDKYLEKIAGSGCRFAYDKYSSNPSYLSFKFPLKKQAAVPVPSDGAKVQVLAVDDQPVILELISAMCQTLGFNVATAQSGAEALVLTKENEYDVILTDLAMPGMSGLELSRLLRIEHPETPIILITGWEATIDRQELEDSGVSDILYKPFRIEQLTNLVKAAATGQSA